MTLAQITEADYPVRARWLFKTLAYTLPSLLVFPFLIFRDPHPLIVSLIFLAIIVLVGGASIANYMYANVYERRREIGTLMALGAGSRTVLKIFLLKALMLGLAGGVGGYLVGTFLAVTMGPRLAGVPVLPLPTLALWAVVLSVLIALAASYFPARRAARIDPSQSLQEV